MRPCDTSISRAFNFSYKKETEMSKIPYKEFIKSITMFFINDDVDRKYLEKRAEKLSALRQQMQNINTLEGLKAYIRNNEDSLSNL